MTATPFMQLYIADYLGDTQHLTTEQHGAYLLILMAMWRADGKLPNDPAKLSRIARVTPRRWHLLADDVMAFFDINGDTISQKRLVQERQKAAWISEKRSASGKLGGNAKALKNNKLAVAIATDLPEHSQIPKPEIEPNGSLSETSSDAPKRSRGKRTSYPEPFEAAWLAYPTDKNMSKAEGFDAWKRLDEDDRAAVATSIPAFRAYCRANPDYRPIHFCRFVQKRRFDGFAAPASSSEADDALWVRRLTHGRNSKAWSSAEWGPKPGESGCLVPRHLLQPGDGEGWSEWQARAA